MPREAISFCGSEIVFQELVGELEVCLPPVHPAGSRQPHCSTLSSMDLPCALIVEEAICSLLKFLRYVLWLLVPLEPRLVLLVKPPALTLERLGREILLVCPLAVVECVEQAVCVDPAV